MNVFKYNCARIWNCGSSSRFRKRRKDCVTDKGLQVLLEMQNLKRIELNSSCVQGIAIGPAPGTRIDTGLGRDPGQAPGTKLASSLQVLKLVSSCERLQDPGLCNILRVCGRNLRFLDLGESSISGLEILNLEKGILLPWIETLNLEYCTNISDKGLCAILR